MTLRSRSFTAFLAPLLALVFATLAGAQPAVATLAGQVVDPQGAAVPGATVSVHSDATGSLWATTTSTDGRFSLPLLPPGTYRAQVELSGFATWQATDVVLQVGQRVWLNVRLGVTAVRETVSVVAVARPASSAVDGVLAAAAIETLPLNGRNFLELSLLVPGNAPTRRSIPPRRTASWSRRPGRWAAAAT